MPKIKPHHFSLISLTPNIFPSSLDPLVCCHQGNLWEEHIWFLASPLSQEVGRVWSRGEKSFREAPTGPTPDYRWKQPNQQVGSYGADLYCLLLHLKSWDSHNKHKLCYPNDRWPMPGLCWLVCLLGRDCSKTDLGPRVPFFEHWRAWYTLARLFLFEQVNTHFISRKSSAGSMLTPPCMRSAGSCSGKPAKAALYL